MKKIINMAASFALFQCVTFNLDAAHYNIDFNENTININNTQHLIRFDNNQPGLPNDNQHQAPLINQHSIHFDGERWTIDGVILNTHFLLTLLHTSGKDALFHILIAMNKIQTINFLQEQIEELKHIIHSHLISKKFLPTDSNINNLRTFWPVAYIDVINERIDLERAIIPNHDNVDNERKNQLNHEILAIIENRMQQIKQRINTIKNHNYCPEIFKNAISLKSLKYEYDTNVIILEFYVQNQNLHQAAAADAVGNNNNNMFFERRLDEPVHIQQQLRTVKLDVVTNVIFPQKNYIKFQQQQI